MSATHALVRHSIRAIVLFATITALLADCECTDRGSPVTEVAQGRIRGSTIFSRSGRPIYSFRGLPYAKPPIGKLRFKEPERPESWEGIFDATRNGNDCVQKNYLIAGSTVQGQEDCLFLNVYTHQLSDKFDIYSANPVMVYIHGGGWFAGSGSSVFNGPEYLMDEDIVLVTINYRLGALGFISTGDDNASGNWGLKDQVSALEWVQENIHFFGGDRESVTIFGQSAGAASVHYHMLSPLSRGLFHKAISESGSALSLWARPLDPLPIAQKQARLVGCPEEDNAQLVECLRTIDAVNLTQSGDNFKFWSIDPLTIFTPVIEYKTGLEAGRHFLLRDPLDIIHSKAIPNPVPWIIGVVSNEGVIRAAPIISNPKELSELNERFDELGPKLMELPKSVHGNASKDVWKNITDYYLSSLNALTEENYQGFMDLYSDRAFVYGSYQSALLHAEAGHTPIYFYHIDYKGLSSWSKLFSGSDKDFGVSHCDELIYLFKIPLLFPEVHNGHIDIDISKKIIGLWTSFAAKGDPTPTNNKVTNVKWQHLPNLIGKQSKNEDLFYLNIGKMKTKVCEKAVVELKMERSFYQQRMHFWSALPLAENLNTTVFALNSVQ